MDNKTKLFLLFCTGLLALIIYWGINYNHALIEITSSLPDFTVTTNNTTEICKKQCTLKLPPKNYFLSIEKEGYQPLETNILVLRGKTYPISYNPIFIPILEPTVANLKPLTQIISQSSGTPQQLSVLKADGTYSTVSTFRNPIQNLQASISQNLDYSLAWSATNLENSLNSESAHDEISQVSESSPNSENFPNEASQSTEDLPEDANQTTSPFPQPLLEFYLINNQKETRKKLDMSAILDKASASFSPEEITNLKLLASHLLAIQTNSSSVYILNLQTNLLTGIPANSIDHIMLLSPTELLLVSPHSLANSKAGDNSIFNMTDVLGFTSLSGLNSDKKDEKGTTNNIESLTELSQGFTEDSTNEGLIDNENYEEEILKNLREKIQTTPDKLFKVNLKSMEYQFLRELPKNFSDPIEFKTVLQESNILQVLSANNQLFQILTEPSQSTN